MLTMQTTEDGEYIPTKELKTSFRIPKKPQSGAAGPNQAATLAAALAAPPPPPPPSPPAQNQVMENSYYNYYNNYLPKQAAIYAAQQQQQQQTAFATAPSTATEHVQSLVLNILQKETEKPKTYANHILRDTIPDLFDETLPKELTGLFQPLYCKLCTAQLSSNVVAKLHYKSKNHEKKIRKFLCDYATQHGQPLHPRARNTSKNHDGGGANGGAGGDPQNPQYFYCDVCDLPLTGKMHAESHYLGKNHRRAILGIKRPAGKGYYDSSGKWIREKRVSEEIAARGDTFGTSFIPHTALSAGAVVPGVAVAPITAATPTIGPPPPKRKHMDEFGCSICNVVTTCTQQLESHLKGHKHQKKLKQLQLSGGVLPGGVASSAVITTAGVMVPNYPPPPTTTDAYYLAQPATGVDYLAQQAVLAQPLQNSYLVNSSVLSSTATTTTGTDVTHSAVSALINPETVQLGDCSAYRTPSGQYYCPVCNNTQSSVIQFRQHLNSKSHLKKAAAQKKS